MRQPHSPGAALMARTPNPIYLDNWELRLPHTQAAIAPEGGLCALHGQIKFTTSRRNGTWSDDLLVLSREGELLRLEDGKLYQLGEPHPSYEAQFPGARERLLKRLPESM